MRKYLFRTSLRLLGIFSLFYLYGCMAAGHGVVHTVGRGETLWRICKTYNADLQEVAEINNIKKTTDIEVGQKIFIPGASRVKKVTPYFAPSPNEKEKEGKIVIEKDRFIWPVKGSIISAYGIRNGSRHDGIDIKAEEGAPIKAADSGEVVFSSSSMRGYGNIIIIKHRGEFYTVYAHNKENLVKQGVNVSKGDIVAKVGATGNASGCHLHFEVRQGKSVRNPLFFLP